MRGHRLVVCAALVGGCSFELSGFVPVPDDAPPPIDAIDARPVPACFGALCRRTTLTIDHTLVSGGPLTAFPVLVDVTLPDLAVNAAATGFDLTFVAADGTTALAYERELFAGDHLVAWVTVPSVASAADTVLYLYYGDPNASVDAQSPAAVWGSDYAAVWHLEDPTGGLAEIDDATVHGHHGTDEGGLTLAAAGKIGRAIEFDGLDDRLRIASTAALEEATNAGTLSVWVSFTAAQAANPQRILMTALALLGGGDGIEWGTQSPGAQDLHYIYPSQAGGGNYHGIVSPFVSGQWHHVAVTIDFAAKRVAIFVDGQPRTPLSDFTATMWMVRPTPSDWYWGGVPPYTRIAGRMDEIRVATTVRSAGWIATEFANQNAPTAFVVAGATAVGP